ncbi:hypothetical protein ESCO_006114 [Escovopsis weberi]|uniref:Beta-xylosidase n=1 Tax=Escovopsis weberi TaxID=150374 RepID=A0A0M8MZX0_ESCWE|nr:hypothetical protein ESCO_006114 [Escovopsis weberi]
MMPQGIPSRRKPTPKFTKGRLAKNPQLAWKLQQMALELSPFVQINTGIIHPDFPKTILQFWLLTEEQLEDLAQFYHQRTPCELGSRYPCPVKWRSDAPLEEKRYNLGRFIGLLNGPPPVALKTEEQIAEEVRLASRDAAAWRRKMNPFSQ